MKIQNHSRTPCSKGGSMLTVKQKTRDKILRVSVSPKFTAILDCLLDVEPRRTNPALASLILTSDEILRGMRQGDLGYNEILGSWGDLHANIVGVSKVAKLTTKEHNFLVSEICTLQGGE